MKNTLTIWKKPYRAFRFVSAYKNESYSELIVYFVRGIFMMYFCMKSQYNPFVCRYPEDNIVILTRYF